MIAYLITIFIDLSIKILYFYRAYFLLDYIPHCILRMYRESTIGRTLNVRNERILSLAIKLHLF